MRFFVTLGIAALPLTSCSISTAPRASPHPPFAISEHDERTPLLVFSHEHHTGLVLPRKALKSELPEIATQSTGVWLEFGWGDEGFYRSEAVTFPPRLPCFSLPHPRRDACRLKQRPASPRLRLCTRSPLLSHEPTEEILVRRLAAQFARDSKGRLLPLGPGRYGASQFYSARARFFFPKTCNAWTASHLRALGYRVGAVTAPGLCRDFENLSERLQYPNHPEPYNLID